jgi:hypothetical protein
MMADLFDALRACSKNPLLRGDEAAKLTFCFKSNQIKRGNGAGGEMNLCGLTTRVRQGSKCMMFRMMRKSFIKPFGTKKFIWVVPNCCHRRKTRQSFPRRKNWTKPKDSVNKPLSRRSHSRVWMWPWGSPPKNASRAHDSCGRWM